ncbi:MAG TPA: siderophore ABC transporter substrate-binding protein [Pseudogracilibacillus sp.]|nr:siderophore ABC transporter substrate-binding protein [Pseudogracilibacillus sp.]
MMRRIQFGFILTILTVLVIGCSSNSENSDISENRETVTVEHELGTTEVKKNPEKTVVFDFGVLDTLDALEVDVAGLPQQLIPSYLEKYESDDYVNVGSLKEPDFEAIAEINPDLIIISTRQAELYDQFQEIADTVYLGLDTTRYMDSFKENVNIIGEIYGKEKEVDEEIAMIDDSIEELHEKAGENDQNALIILANDDKVSAYGPNSRFGFIHDEFGILAVDNDIEVSTHGMNVTFEYVVEQDPDLLYVVDRSAAIGEGSTAEQLVENTLVERTKAYQNDNIFYLNPDYWYLSGGGLVSVTEMIQEIDASLE